MPKARPDDLVYGHLGEAIYDPNSKRWYFKRVPGIHRQLQSVGDFALTLESPLLNAPATCTLSAPSRTKYVNQLVKIEPSLAAAAHSLPRLVQLSEAVNDVTSTFDSITSTLLSFGTAFNHGKRRSEKNHVDVAAVAGGSAGEVLCLLHLDKHEFGWEDHKGVQLLVPTIDKTKQGCWRTSRGPIEQICFSEDHGRPGAWLAVRHPGITSILRPLVHYQSDNSNPAVIASRKSSLPSYLDANPIAEVPIQSTGGAVHVDITFNPWNQRQFAVLDVLGRWSVWDIESRPGKRNRWSVVAVLRGQLSRFMSDDLAGEIRDGWGRILWVEGATTIAMATRGFTAFYDTVAVSEQIKGPDLELQLGSHWILDMKRSPVDSAHVFILSSLCIHWLRVSRAKELNKGTKEGIVIDILLTKQHFRSQEDRTLQMLLYAREGETVVMLHSSHSELVTVFDFSMIRSLQLPQSLSDPFVMYLSNAEGRVEPKEPIPRNVVKTFATLSMALVVYTVFDTVESFEPGSVLMDDGIAFYKLFVLYNDLSIEERLYVMTTEGHNLKKQDLPRIIPPGRHKATTPLSGKSFVVEDRFEVGMKGSGSALILSKSFATTAQSASIWTRHDRWTLNFEWLASAAEDMDLVLSRQDSNVEDFVGSLQHSLKHLTMDSIHGIQSLDELIVNVPMDNPNNASSMLQEFLNGVHEGDIIPDSGEIDDVLLDHRLRIWSLLAPEDPAAIVDRADGDGEVLLLPLYETLLVLWISSLGSNVQGRIRVSVEKRLRTISARLYLSSYGLWYAPDVKEQVAAHSDGERTLPLRRKGSASSSSRKGNDKARDSSPSQPPESESQDLLLSTRACLPTPEPTPSLHSQQSSALDSGSSLSPCDRLRAFAQLRAQPPLTESLTRLISHWTVGADPKVYDWTRIQESLIAQIDTERGDKRRSQRQLDKHIKRQRVDSQGGSSHPESTRAFSSQAHASRTQAGSSQLAVSPFPYGGFEQITKKSGTPKRRKAGF